jgi:hypothetical protein
MSLNRSGIAFSSALGVVLLGTIFVSPAAADCGYRNGPPVGLAIPQSWQGPAEIEPSLLLVGHGQRAHDRIVGFWKVKMVSEGSDGIPDGTVIDDGYAQWHSDGTEVTNSLFDPATGSVCYGVWKKTGPSKYSLNHFGFAWDANGLFLGTAQIRQDVVVDRKGHHFQGTFSIDQYDPSGKFVYRVVGKVIATRITVHTTIQQVL